MITESVMGRLLSLVLNAFYFTKFVLIIQMCVLEYDVWTTRKSGIESTVKMFFFLFIDGNFLMHEKRVNHLSSFALFMIFHRRSVKRKLKRTESHEKVERRSIHLSG